MHGVYMGHQPMSSRWTISIRSMVHSIRAQHSSLGVPVWWEISCVLAPPNHKDWNGPGFLPYPSMLLVFNYHHSNSSKRYQGLKAGLLVIFLSYHPIPIGHFKHWYGVTGQRGWSWPRLTGILCIGPHTVPVPASVPYFWFPLYPNINLEIRGSTYLLKVNSLELMFFFLELIESQICGQQNMMKRKWKKDTCIEKNSTKMRLDNVNIKDGKKKQWKYREKWKTREKCLLALLVKLMKRHIHHADYDQEALCCHDRRKCDCYRTWKQSSRRTAKMKQPPAQHQCRCRAQY